VTEPDKDLIRASDVERVNDLTPERKRQRDIAKVARQRRTRNEALRRTGALDGRSSPDNAMSLEATANAAREESYRRFKAKRAVAAALRKKAGS